MAYDLVSNALLLGIGATIGLLIFQRCMEAREMTYSVTAVPNGTVFKFSLGIYAGKVRITRKVSCVKPWFIRHVDGWEIIFPMAYGDDEINDFIMKNNPPLAGDRSHAKDLYVYREVMIKNNLALSCVNGRICKFPK